jgi:hypothetical protein
LKLDFINLLFEVLDLGKVLVGEGEENLEGK